MGVMLDLNNQLVAENARLQSEVERLTEIIRREVDGGVGLREEAQRTVEENHSLKAENERLKVVSTIEQRTIQGLQQTPEWSEIARLTAECRRLEAENARLRSSSFVTAVPVEQYERVVKAGDAMALTLQADYNGVPYEPLVVINAIIYWRSAKEGKPSV